MTKRRGERATERRLQTRQRHGGQPAGHEKEVSLEAHAPLDLGLRSAGVPSRFPLSLRARGGVCVCARSNDDPKTGRREPPRMDSLSFKVMLHDHRTPGAGVGRVPRLVICPPSLQGCRCQGCGLYPFAALLGIGVSINRAELYRPTGAHVCMTCDGHRTLPNARDSAATTPAPKRFGIVS